MRVGEAANHVLRRCVPSSPTKWSVAVAAITLLMAACGWAEPAPAQASVIRLEKGISFTGYSANSYSGAGPRSSLRQLRDTGATFVMILVTMYQDNVDSTAITRTSSRTPTDESLAGIIRYAHRIGMRVMLKPQLDLLHDDKHCRSQIGIHFSRTEWRRWFSSYQEDITHYAALANRTDCEQYSVGCELDNTVNQGRLWRRTIARVRTVYHGIVTYAADLYMDSPTDRLNVQWWDAVDVMGFDMYPMLTSSSHPSVSGLVSGWLPYYAALGSLHTRWHRPVIFTETGVRSVAGGSQAPWDSERTAGIDLKGQTRWYEALFKTIAAHRWVRGLFIWQWSTSPTAGGVSDSSYSPHLKPAEGVLRRWFARAIP